MILLLFTLAVTACFSKPLTDCRCNASDPSQAFILPSNSTGAPAQIRSSVDSTQCWSYQKSVGGIVCDGVCIFLGPCDNSTIAMTWRWDRNASWLRVASPAPLAGWCADENLGQRYLQAYPNCEAGDTHQLWGEDGSPGRVHERWSGGANCMASPGGGCVKPAPPPPPQSLPSAPSFTPYRALGSMTPLAPCWTMRGGGTRGRMRGGGRTTFPGICCTGTAAAPARALGASLAAWPSRPAAPLPSSPRARKRALTWRPART